MHFFGLYRPPSPGTHVSHIWLPVIHKFLIYELGLLGSVFIYFLSHCAFIQCLNFQIFMLMISKEFVPTSSPTSMCSLFNSTNCALISFKFQKSKKNLEKWPQNFTSKMVIITSLTSGMTANTVFYLLTSPQLHDLSSHIFFSLYKIPSQPQKNKSHLE